MIRAIFACAVCLVYAFPLPAKAPPPLPPGVTLVGTVEGVTEYRLANGLQILLIPDASQPKVTVNCTIMVGSRHEGYGETGMAHLLEHMVFKGCPKFLDVPKALSDHGADFNGTTWLDRTNYFETMPATDENLEFGIELEADRLMNSFIAREELMKEFTVVRNEFERTENNAEAILSQRMNAVAYEWHNYGKSTIGNKTDIERVPIDNLKAFYKRYYRPDNAMLVVAGKFETTKALTLINKHFGPIKKPSIPIPMTYTEEPAQDGERFVTLRRVGTVGATGVVYHVPAGSHADYSAVEILESALTAAPSGLLYKKLVETKLASAVQGSVAATHDPGAFEILAQTEPAKTEAARAALVEALEGLMKTPLTAEDVERAKRQLLQQRERTLANTQRFAINLSEWAACGNWKLFFLHRDRLEKVTVEDVNRVAKLYLIRSNRTVGVYIPTDKAERAEVPSSPDVALLVKEYKGRNAMSVGEAFDPTPENVEKRVVRGTVGEGVKYAALSKKTRGETVTLTMTLRFGTLESLKGYVEASDFLGAMLMHGTTDKTRQQIKDEFDKLNAQVGFSSRLGQLSVNVQTKRANLPGTLALIGEVLRKPSFPVKEFEVLHKEEIDTFDKNRNEPQALAGTEMRRRMNPRDPSDVRYMPTLDEGLARMKAVTRDKVKTLYETMIGSQHGEVAIVGEFDLEPTIAQLNTILKGWTASSPYKRIENDIPTPLSGTFKINTPDKANAVYLAGMLLPLSDTDPAYAALQVGNYMLGAAPLASRLSNRVRGKDGLSYGVGSQTAAAPLDKVGNFVIFAITNPKNMEKVDAAIAEEVTKFMKEGVSAAELEEAKKAYLQSQKASRANDRALAGQLAGSLYAGRTFAYYTELEKRIEAVQPDDVKKTFEALVDPKKMVIIQAGDLDKK